MTIGHDLSAVQPYAITVAGGSIGHDLQITGVSGVPSSGENYVCGAMVAHDLIVQNGAASSNSFDIGDTPWCNAGNQVGHDPVVTNNADPVDVSDNGTAANPIGHDLTVQDNNQGPRTKRLTTTRAPPDPAHSRIKRRRVGWAGNVDSQRHGRLGSPRRRVVGS